MKDITTGIIVGTLMVAMILMVMGVMLQETVDVNTYIQCCNGSQCTDTYYTEEDNLCHLVLCENDAFTDKAKCTYQGANITNITMLSELR